MTSVLRNTIVNKQYLPLRNEIREFLEIAWAGSNFNYIFRKLTSQAFRICATITILCPAVGAREQLAKKRFFEFSRIKMNYSEFPQNRPWRIRFKIDCWKKNSKKFKIADFIWNLVFDLYMGFYGAHMGLATPKFKFTGFSSCFTRIVKKKISTKYFYQIWE